MSHSDVDIMTDRSWYDNDSVHGNVTHVDVRILAREHGLYKIGKCQYASKRSPTWQLLKRRFYY